MIIEDSAERKLQLKKLKEWEILINKVSTDSAHVSVENDVDLEGPPADMTYITEMKPAPGIVIPDDPPMGCECSGKHVLYRILLRATRYMIDQRWVC